MTRVPRVLLAIGLLATAVLGVSSAIDEDVQANPAGDLEGGLAAFQPTQPARLADTRSGEKTTDGRYAGGGPLSDGETFELDVVGRGGVPDAGVQAVVLNVVALGATSPGGYLTIYPTGTPRPLSANTTYSVGPPRSVATIAEIGSEGRVSIYAFTSTDLVVDVVGWFPSGGTFTSVGPARIADTRPSGTTIDGASAATGVVSAETSLEVQLAGRSGVPESGAVAVAVSITAVGSTAPGFLTTHATGTPRPNASTLNYVGASPVTNLAVVDSTTSGMLSVFASSDTHVVVDVIGWFGAGDFAPTQPARLVDLRPDGSTVDGACITGWRNTTGETIDVLVAGRGGVPKSGAGTVVMNVTAVNSTSESGFLTVHAEGTERPLASSLNYGSHYTIVERGARVLTYGPTANLVFAQLSPTGTVSMYSWGPTHLVVDVVGWFPGEAQAEGSPCPPPPFDADTIELEWIEPLEYQTRPADNDPSITISRVVGTARIAPPLFKIGGAVGVIVRSTDGTTLAVYLDSFTLNFGINDNTSNVQALTLVWEPPLRPAAGVHEVGQVCLFGGSASSQVEDCRDALPHEAISFVVPDQ